MSKGTQATTSTSQPPAEVLQAYQQLISAGQAQAQQPLQQYGGSQVAGFTPQQQQAFSTIQGAQGLAQPYINAGASMIGQSAAPISPNGLISGDQLSGLAQQGLGYTGAAANTGIAAAGQPGISSAMSAAGTQLPQFNQDTLQQYLNPYLGGQVAATQAEFNNQNAQTAQGLNSQAIKAGAFGGDRAGVAQGIAAGQEQLAQAPVIAGLESNAYQQATGLFTQQQQEQLAQQQLQSQTGLGAAGLAQGAAGQQGQLGLSAAQQLYGLFGGQQQTGLSADQASAWLGENAGAQLAGLGSTAQNTALTGANANLTAGTLQQQLAQEQLNIPYEQFLAQQAYPYQNLQFLAGLTTGAGSNAGGTSTTTQPAPSLVSQIGGLGLAAASLFKSGGRVHRAEGGGLPSVPDVSVAFIPDINTTKGGGPPKPPNVTQEDNPIADSVASMNQADAIKKLFNKGNGTDPAMAGKLSGIQSTWDAINASPETAGNFLAAKFGGRIHRADGGGLQSPNYIGASPNTQNMFGRFTSMPEEQLRELAVRMPPGSSQGQMIQQALRQKQMMPANDNNQGLAATGTTGMPTGLAMGGIAHMASGGSGGAVQGGLAGLGDDATSDLVRAELSGGHGPFGSLTSTGMDNDLGKINYLAGKAALPPTTSFTPGARGTQIPQVSQSLFAAPTGLASGEGLPGWFNPLPQYHPDQTPIVTQLPDAVKKAVAPPPAPVADPSMSGLGSLTPDQVTALSGLADQKIKQQNQSDKSGGRVHRAGGGDTPIYGGMGLSMPSGLDDMPSGRGLDQVVPDAIDMPAGGLAETQPTVPDAHDAVEVKGGPSMDDLRTAFAGHRSAPKQTMVQASNDAGPSMDDLRGAGIGADQGLAGAGSASQDGLAAAGPPAPPDIAKQAPAPTAKAPSGADFVPGKTDPRMALLTAGLAIAAGRSPYALSNIGAGGLAGVKEYMHESELDSKPEVDHSGETVRIYYPSEKKWIDTGLPTNESQKTKATAADSAARLAQTGQLQGRSLDIQQQRADQAGRDAAATEAYRRSELGLRQSQLDQGKFTAQPVKDAMGNPIGTNLIDNKSGKVTFQPMTADATGKPQNADLTKTGDEFLNTLPADTQRTVKAIVEGRQAPPTSFAMSKPYWQQMMSYANQYDPTLDQTTWAARNKTRSAFATGQEAKNVTALNTTLQHADVLSDTFDKLDNTSVPWANVAKNWLATQAGSAAPTNAKEAVSAVASEARKVFAGSGGGGLAELDQWEKNFPVNGSPDQQKGAIKQLVGLMDSRLNALGDQYNRGMSKADDPVALLAPEAQKAYTKLTGRPANGTAIGGDGKAAEAQGIPSFTNPGEASKLPSGSAFYAVMPDGTKKLKYVP